LTDRDAAINLEPQHRRSHTRALRLEDPGVWWPWSSHSGLQFCSDAWWVWSTHPRRLPRPADAGWF